MKKLMLIIKEIIKITACVIFLGYDEKSFEQVF